MAGLGRPGISHEAGAVQRAADRACTARAEEGTPVAEVRRKARIGAATHCVRRKRFDGLTPSATRRVKRLAADLALGEERLQDVVKRKLRSLRGGAKSSSTLRRAFCAIPDFSGETRDSAARPLTDELVRTYPPTCLRRTERGSGAPAARGRNAVRPSGCFGRAYEQSAPRDPRAWNRRRKQAGSTLASARSAERSQALRRPPIAPNSPSRPTSDTHRSKGSRRGRRTVESARSLNLNGRDDRRVAY